MKKRWQAHNHPEMTSQEMARCRPASEVDQLGLPIPTHLVSNEEYFPPFLQTAQQQQVEARVLDALDEVPKRLSISRRRFLTTSAGLAASFVALNEVFRDYAFGATLFRVGKEAGFDFDLPNSPFPSNPWNPGNHGDEHGDPWASWNPALIGQTNLDDTEFWLPNFIKSFYFESQTTVAPPPTATTGYRPCGATTGRRSGPVSESRAATGGKAGSESGKFGPWPAPRRTRRSSGGSTPRSTRATWRRWTSSWRRTTSTTARRRFPASQQAGKG